MNGDSGSFWSRCWARVLVFREFMRCESEPDKAVGLDRPPSSVVKAFYFLFFTTTIGYFLFETWLVFVKWAAAWPKDLAWYERPLGYSVAFLTTVVACVHFVRVYMTIELLDSPFLDLHEKYIQPLGNIQKYFEFGMRGLILFVVAFYALKFSQLGFVKEMLGYPQLQPTSFEFIVKYFIGFYVSVISWDLFSLICFMCNKVKRPPSFLIASAGGVIFWSLLAHLLIHEPDADDCRGAFFAALLYLVLVWSTFQVNLRDHKDFLIAFKKELCCTIAPGYVGSRRATSKPE